MTGRTLIAAAISAPTGQGSTKISLSCSGNSNFRELFGVICIVEAKFISYSGLNRRIRLTTRSGSELCLLSSAGRDENLSICSITRSPFNCSGFASSRNGIRPRRDRRRTRLSVGWGRSLGRSGCRRIARTDDKSCACNSNGLTKSSHNGR
jgi:hypothetical protein